MVQGGMTCVKYLVFAFNLIFFCFGIALIAVGAVVQIQLRDYMDFFAEGVNGPAIMLIIIGLIIFVISFFGCCGAIKENYCMVITFAALLIVILVCEVGGAIAGFVYSSKLESLLREGMLDSRAKYSDNTDIQKTWNDTQKSFGCCGVTGPKDWEVVTRFDDQPPQSCCPSTDVCEYTHLENEKVSYMLGIQPLANNLIIDYTLQGCLEALKGQLTQNVFTIGAVGISLAIIQIFGVGFGCCLARSIKRSAKQSYSDSRFVISSDERLA